MAWQHVLGHDEIAERFRLSLARGRMAGSFLFTGPSGIGKRTFALNLARALLCPNADEREMAPCGVCDSCVQVFAGTHPDLLTVAKPLEKSFLPLELLIGDKEHRMREGLCHDISLKPYQGGRKVAIIDDADFLNIEGANCLLKTLEEPPPKSVVILIGTSPAKQLPTIRSRCRSVRFSPLTTENVAEILVREQLFDDPSQADALARVSRGSVQRALQMNDESLSEFQGVLLNILARHPLDSYALGQQVAEFVDVAGKVAPARRARLRLAIEMANDFYRAVLRSRSGDPTAYDNLAPESARKADAWQGDAALAAELLDRCLTAYERIDRNVHLVTLVEHWTDSLANV
jgi:DNA polymerase III subunit delta'